MENQLLARLNEIKVDTEGALRRFCGNEALYERFLLKFGQDTTFVRIQEAMASQNWDAMMNEAHTLKGITGNLGMNRLYQACATTVTLLRTQGRAEEQIFTCFDELHQAYQEVIDALTLK